MNKTQPFEVTITETLQTRRVIYAKDQAEAEEEIRRLYDDGNIVLDYDNFKSVDIRAGEQPIDEEFAKDELEFQKEAYPDFDAREEG